MKAQRLICHGIRRIEVEEFEIGAVSDNAILVHNEYTAVSVGTELWSWVHGAEPGEKAKFPHTTGYCNAGTVVEIGKNVTDVKVGDRVAGQGSHASHSTMQKPYNKVPLNVPCKSASLLTMAAIAMHGARVAKIELGEAVAVVGLGLIGQFALSLAKLNGGLPVIAVDLNDMRLAKAKDRGADACINPGKTSDVTEAVRALCVEDGANVVIESTGIPAVYPMAVKLACIAGRMIALGSPRGKVEFDFMEEVHLREVSILGAIHPLTPAQSNIYFWWTKDRERNLLLRLMGSGRLTTEDLITHVAKPDDCQNIYNMLADRPNDALGVLFDWTK
ncbi:MAG: zinc-binding alcohol dehydrogenase [Kiritimatiellaeota bacterium]|nr:zinc-binding alcohol dehydrogenase [Kiritimatiellota bacterium]